MVTTEVNISSVYYESKSIYVYSSSQYLQLFNDDAHLLIIRAHFSSTYSVYEMIYAQILISVMATAEAIEYQKCVLRE